MNSSSSLCAFMSHQLIGFSHFITQSTREESEARSTNICHDLEMTTGTVVVTYPHSLLTDQSLQGSSSRRQLCSQTGRRA